MLANLRKNPNSTWFSIAAIGLLLILAAALSGVIRNFFTGEEFIIYHYADGLPHNRAWVEFFFDYGRVIEALYWSYQYELLGYNPLLAHSLSFVLLLIVSILASICFLNVWPRGKTGKALPYLFFFSFFLNWISMSSVFRLSYDNNLISMAFFFLAGLSLQKWAVSQRGRWLGLSFGLFLVSVLSYENTAFLFPALLLLVWPLMPVSKKTSLRSRTFAFGGLAAVSGLILLIPYLIYSHVDQTHSVSHPALGVDLGTLLTNLIGTGSKIYLRFGQVGNFGVAPLKILVATGLFLILALSTAWIVNIHRGNKHSPETKSRWTFIYFASLWFLIFGPLPYVLLNYDVGGRVYSSAVFGVFPLLLMVYDTAYRKILRGAAIAIVLMFAGFGFLTMRSEATYFNQLEPSLNAFYRGLKEVVPHVRPNTIFIFIDPSISIGGCGPSMEMLYGQKNLTCAILSSMYPKYYAIRHAGEIETDGEHLMDENWILINMVDNMPRVLEELKPGDFDLLMTWESTEPIRTDAQKIDTKDVPPPSDFYLHLLERAKVLFPK
jgi:hypothetical protein